MSRLPDQTAREQALDVQTSFIVQAPAGSGKTELLSLRYLNLLSTCEEPEEVLAITFTKKAASEMKDRIVQALQSAAGEDESRRFEDELQQRRHRIARSALDQNARKNWQILENPARLRIQTIDSFCLSLATRIPLLSQLGGVPNLSNEASQCFTDAIINTLQQLNTDSELGDDIARLLSHLDNDVSQAEKLLSSLLGSRDQWLPHILGIHASNLIDRDYLQNALEELIEESLTELRRRLAPFEAELVTLLNFSAAHLEPDQSGDQEHFQTLAALPGCDPASLPCWLRLEHMLLTRSTDPAWRARITKREGFPASIPGDKEQTALCKQRKQQWSDLLAQLSTQDTLLDEIAYLRLLPDPTLEDAQWDFLTALTRILTHLSSELLLSFRRFRQVDHAQVAAAALAALGPEQEPTDLALALDHRIRHILVDEFQDTSKMQTDLLKQLTAGWEPDDGRSLFLVGDAMQSVYGFRNANVGIYLKVQEEGLGDIPLYPLTLQSNFRSQANVVQWVNQVFVAAFPPYSNPSRGAVPYTPSVASNPALDGLGISSEFISYEAEQKELARECEARQVARRVLALKETDPGASIAILVRSRTHLGALIPALRAEGIHWQATDIDRMESLPVIEDLQSLTRAILNTGDRIAWLAILRAPWCGLSLADLQVIATHQDAASIWSSLENQADLDTLSQDGRERLQDFVRIMSHGLNRRFRCGLRHLVEALWTLLDGAATAQSETEQASVARYLDLLEEHESGGGLRDYPEFARQVARTFLPSISSEESSNVHLLTMHKAKGLEYDHVILPCLGAGSQSDDKPLLLWHERVNQLGDDRLFIAARSPSGKDDDPLYRLVRFEEARKSRFEAVRLLYIAVTRARKSAHLTATLGVSSQGETTPPRGSLLYHIWPQLQEPGDQQHMPRPLEQFSADGIIHQHSQDYRISSLSTTPIKRFAEPLRLQGRALHLIEQSLVQDNGLAEASDLSRTEHLAYPDGETEPAATTGVLIHQALETLVSNPEVFKDERSRSRLRQYWRLQLESLTPDADRLRNTLDFIELSINKCIQTPECAWVFDANLTESATELPISRAAGGNLYHYVVDRTFVDEAGTRWIIDYKTAAPDAGVSEESFIAQQLQLHRSQLQNYKTLFEEMETRAPKMALLFTAIPKLVEFD